MRSPQAFLHAVEGFRLVPRSWTAPAAFLIVTAEIGIAVFVLLGGRLLVPGFALAGAFLLFFTAALASVLARRFRTPCNCLGASDRPVSLHHLWRNLGFVAIAGAGLWASLARPGTAAPPSAVDWTLAAFAATALLLVSIYLEDIHGALHADDARL